MTPTRETPEETLSRLDLPIAVLEQGSLRPFGEVARAAAPTAADARPDSLPNQITRAYDLSVAAAIEANIPVAGGGGFSASRRVIVLERVGYDERATSDGGVEHEGFAIRLCVTVNKLDVNVKLTLPFIAASAQIGSTEAVWSLQIVGLRGPRIAAISIVPTELDVETFVLAKQQLKELVEAIVDPTTILDRRVIARRPPASSIEARYGAAVGHAAGLGAIARGWSVAEAAGKHGWAMNGVPLEVVAAYQDVAGITSVADRPDAAARERAVRLLAWIDVRPR